MNRLNMLRFPVVGAFALAGLVPVSALAQSPSAEVSADAASSAQSGAMSSVRDGWTLATSDAPAFSVQLPPDWSQSAATSGIAATSTAGEALATTPEALPDEADFDTWVTRVETDLEKAAKDDLPTTFRQVGTGVVARIDEGTTAGTPEGRGHGPLPLPALRGRRPDDGHHRPGARGDGGRRPR